ncbi:MAG: hypothetical protein ACKVVP_16285 [Chloroflexota bacterium]
MPAESLFVEPALSTASSSVLSVMPSAATMADEHVAANIAARVPASLSRAQVYFWSYDWQLGESESDEDIHNGEVAKFGSARDAIRWLLTND